MKEKNNKKEKLDRNINKKVARSDYNLVWLYRHIHGHMSVLELYKYQTVN